MAFAVVSLLSGGSNGSSSSATTSVSRSNGSSTTAEKVPSKPEGDLRAAPALRIHPQRAAAGLPLELQVDGIGCPGNAGILSITQVGTAATIGGPDRLVVRRRFDVDPATHGFGARPLLVGQPPGSYRVAIECDRFRAATQPLEVPTRDVFALTEVLELTGEQAAHEFDVVPMAPMPGEATTFSIAGAGCEGPGVKAVVRVFMPRTLPINATSLPLAPPPTAPVRMSGGTWIASFTVPAGGAFGTYTFAATCFDGDVARFTYVDRLVHFGGLAGADNSVFSWFGGGPAAKPTASATAAAAQAVPGTPRFTG